MLFPTIDFAIFFALVFLGHWLLNHEPLPWKLFMIGASYVFYAWWDWHYVWLLAGVSAPPARGDRGVAPDRRDARGGSRWRWHRPRDRAAALLQVLLVGVARVHERRGEPRPRHLGLPLVQLILPVGISFFTFMAISYIVDVYRGHTHVASWIDVFLYLSFFPHLVAGPIVRPTS